ncbi:MAG: universal stress protein [Mycobacteriales bacterium]
MRDVHPDPTRLRARSQTGIRAEVEALAYAETHERTHEPGAPAPRAAEPPRTRPVVVVGADPVAGSEGALAWAVQEVLRRDGDLVLLGVSDPDVDLPPELVHQQERSRLEELVAQVRAAHPEVRVTVELLCGAAGPVLVDRSRGSALLVVGTRGRGALSRALMGSVSSYCATHAHCPTVVVPATWTP